jgi:hypothetical protein
MTLKPTEIAVIRLDSRGLWTVDLYTENRHTAGIGGSYPKSSYCEIDAKRTWGHSIEIKLVRLTDINEVESWLDSLEN